MIQKIQLAKNKVHDFLFRQMTQPRVDYFYNSSRSEDGKDSLYREAVESLLDDPKWYYFAHAVDYWVSLGHDTLGKWQAAYFTAKQATLNQLFQSAFKELDAGRFPIDDGEKFAQIVRDRVIERRRKGA